MSNRQRRRPSATTVDRATRCRSCRSYSTLTEHEPGVWTGTIHHDDWCPEYARHQARQALGITHVRIIPGGDR